MANNDPWLRLVLRSMSVEELRAEALNDDNTREQRVALIAELARRGFRLTVAK